MNTPRFSTCKGLGSKSKIAIDELQDILVETGNEGVFIHISAVEIYALCDKCVEWVAHRWMRSVVDGNPPTAHQNEKD